MESSLAGGVGQGSLDAELPEAARLIGDMAVLKRMFATGDAESFAAGLFARSWSALIAGRYAADVGLAATAAALVGARLGELDLPTLRSLGVAPDECIEICRRALAESGPVIRARYAGSLEAVWPQSELPGFVPALCRQPRAGATRPGRRRLVLLPAETHADHSMLVAVAGVLLAEIFDADAGVVFLAGLAHHLHNARLPDTGFEGEELLGRTLGPLVKRLTEAELATLPPGLAAGVREALEAVRGAETAEGRAFHAADVFDRVLEVHHHAAAAAFRVEQALDDMELVHPGPLQAFHSNVLRTAGLI